MLEHFRRKYRITSRLPASSQGPVARSPMEMTPGYEEFMTELAGCTFNNGVYRAHSLEGRAKWERLITEVFPKHRDKISVFGYDWMGCQFALDSERREAGQSLVLLFDPGFGEVLQIPATFLDFHEQVLITDSEAALEDEVFEEWLRIGNKGPGPAECVGYKVPLFLGGRDQLDNNELIDMEVYWSLSAQLLAQTRELPDGAPVGKVTIETSKK